VLVVGKDDQPTFQAVTLGSSRGRNTQIPRRHRPGTRCHRSAALGPNHPRGTRRTAELVQGCYSLLFVQPRNSRLRPGMRPPWPGRRRRELRAGQLHRRRQIIQQKGSPSRTIARNQCRISLAVPALTASGLSVVRAHASTGCPGQGLPCRPPEIGEQQGGAAGPPPPAGRNPGARSGRRAGGGPAGPRGGFRARLGIAVQPAAAGLCAG